MFNQIWMLEKIYVFWIMLPCKYVLFLYFYTCIKISLDKQVGAGDIAWFVEVLPSVRETLGLVPALSTLDMWCLCVDPSWREMKEENQKAMVSVVYTACSVFKPGYKKPGLKEKIKKEERKQIHL